FGQDGRMERAGLPGIVNPDDAAAVELALLWAEATGGEAIVATMGPESADDMLGELAAMGCSAAWHLCDDALAGADVLLTAKALAALARRLDADAIVTGAVAADGQTGAVPAAL
ncbi:electron transfer flavoprotein subunit beta, partial [bacterium]|nr:electron transfer flavoprotein subunit beta [bacterium]